MAGGQVLVSSNSEFVCRYYYFGNENGKTVINDSTLNVTCLAYFYDGGKIRFEGSHPKMFVSECFGGSGTARLEFMVPVGGYANVQVQCSTWNGTTLGYWDGSTTGSIYLDVPADAPAKVNGKLGRTTLIYWPTKGINRAYVKDGTLPRAKSDKFIGMDAFGNDLAADSTDTPISLAVLFTPPPGFMLIIR